MDNLTSGHKLRPPSRALPRPRPFTTLTIRTTDQPAPTMPQPAPSSSPGQQQHLNYPIPIHPQKLEKALKLYATYRTAQALAQREAAPATGHHDNPFLNVPNTPTARSITSGGSSRRNKGTSVSTSMYEATDLSSVVSFEDNESPSITNDMPRELTSFNGTKVKQRVRRQFDPAGKARTALVRWLGSCSRCHDRRVPCPIEEHHDIATLERIYAERNSEYRPQSQHRSRSSVSNSSQRTARSTSGGKQNTSGASQADFLGLGQNPQLLQTLGSFNAPHQDVQSPGGYADPLEDIAAPAVFTNLHYAPPVQLVPVPDPYSTYQNGDMLVIGLQQDGYFFCQHQEGCQEWFEDAATLQNHFESVHFPFTRIEPPQRYVCSSCHWWNNMLSDRCQNCGVQGTIQVWIHGHFIRTPTFHHYPANGPAPMRYTSSSNPYYPVYASQSMDSQWRPDMNGNYGNGANPDPFTENTPDGNTYGGTGNQAYGYNGYGGSDSGGNRYQGNLFRDARQMALKHSFPIRVWYSNAIQLCRRLKLLLLFFLLLIAIIFGTHDWVISKARTSFPRAGGEFREHLPTVGFIGIFASFGLSFSVKHLSVRHTPLVQSQPTRCSLRALAPFATRYRQTAPNTYVRCAGPL